MNAYIEQSSNPISYEQTKKILEQMEKNICKIKVDINNNTGAGFFCKIPVANNKKMPVLITNNHIINETILQESNKVITIMTEKDSTRKTLDLSNRLTYNYNQYGIFIIEIKSNDRINDYFELDDNIIKEKQYAKYINKSIYMIQNSKEKLYVSYGTMKNIDSNQPLNFIHSCSSLNESLGAPIINLENYKIIGIHSLVSYNLNKGFFWDFITPIEYKEENKDSIVQLRNSIIVNSANDGNYENLFGMSIEKKQGFCNYGKPESSKLNSIMQILTSIKDIHDDLLNSIFYGKAKLEIINKFSNIYVFTSLFSKALNEIYNKGKPGEHVSLKEMDILLKFIDRDITNKNIYDYFMKILELLHQEFLSYPYNISSNDQLISFNSNYDELSPSKKQFFDYYYNGTYRKSMISELFNWVRRERRFCKHCHVSSYSFQAYPIVLFDLDSMDNFLIKENMYKDNKAQNEKVFKLQECFQIYQIQNEFKGNQTQCTNCGYSGNLYSNYFFETSPLYLIIVINRTKTINLEYTENLELPKDTESNITIEKYKLAGIIMREENNYSCIIKQNEKETQKGVVVEEWKKFCDENITDIKFQKNPENNANSIKVFHPMNAKILIYKGIESLSDAYIDELNKK